jgi:hypothetical protein
MQRWPQVATSSSSSSLQGEGGAFAQLDQAAGQPGLGNGLTHHDHQQQQPQQQQQASKSFHYQSDFNGTNNSFVPSVDAFNVSARPSSDRSLTFLRLIYDLLNNKTSMFYYPSRKYVSCFYRERERVRDILKSWATSDRPAPQKRFYLQM